MVLRADVVGNVGGINVVWKRQDGRPIPTRHVQVRGKKPQKKCDRWLFFRGTVCSTSARRPGRTPDITSVNALTHVATLSSRYAATFK